jgi:spore coat polysaccharide biosynthesis protein SpsF (cytidylyltransferase family)
MRDTRIIIQSRMSSTRLPGKALLPVGDLPSTVLCAKRAGNTGLSVVVATSDDLSDDPLVQTAMKHGVAVSRGSLSNVLSRFAVAATDMPDDGIVVRLTADNLLPDGRFIQGFIDFFVQNRCVYLGPEPTLPYGLCGEVFTAGILREANDGALLPEETEHVTPWMRDRHLQLFAPPELRGDMSRLRVTTDTLDDYLKMFRVFSSVGDPVSADAWKLISLFETLQQSPARTIS